MQAAHYSTDTAFGAIYCNTHDAHINALHIKLAEFMVCQQCRTKLALVIT